MTRGLLATAILGLAALPATAGDAYAPYPGCGAYHSDAPTYAPLTGWHGEVQRGSKGGHCDTCAGHREDRHSRWVKFKDFLCYKPTIPCETWPRPTPYTPPLRMWFPPHGEGYCNTGCANPGILGRRLAPCGNCNSCAGAGAGAGAQVVQSTPAAPPSAPTGPVWTSNAAPPRPTNPAAQAIVPQSYSVTKPAYSTQVHDSSLPPPPPSYLPGAFQPRN